MRFMTEKGIKKGRPVETVPCLIQYPMKNQDKYKHPFDTVV